MSDTEPNLERFAEISKNIELFCSNYSLGLLKAVLKFENGEYSLHSALITFKDEEKDIQDETKNFGKILLLQLCLSPKEMLQIIQDLTEQQTLKIKGHDEYLLEGNFGHMRFAPSRRRLGYIKSEWPSRYVEFRFSKSVNLPSEPLLSSDLDLYPDGNKAAIDFLGLTSPNAENILIIQIPDYRVKINDLRISGNKITIDAEAPNIPNKELIVKFYAHNERSIRNIGEREFYTISSPPYELINGKVEHEFTSEFNYILAAVLDKNTREILDYREYYLSGYPIEGVTIESEELDILEIIRRGEDISVEFKQEIGKEFLETVVAFSNTVGGFIFLGIADDTSVVGFRREESEISNLIVNNIFPGPLFEIGLREIDGKPITIVSVKEGKDKPYSHRQLGIYVRSRSTDRRATRTDLDPIYREREKRTFR